MIFDTCPERMSDVYFRVILEEVCDNFLPMSYLNEGTYIGEAYVTEVKSRLLAKKGANSAPKFRLCTNLRLYSLVFSLPLPQTSY
jgi:hypothetical protein